MNKKILFLLLICLVVGLGGCGKISVSGKVTTQDGAPVNGGEVVFSTPTESFRGAIVDGAYEIKSNAAGKGVPSGDYEVTVESVRPSLGDSGTFAEIYLNEPLKVSVKKATVFDIVVESRENEFVSPTEDSPAQ